MKLLSDSASECIGGGALLSLNVPIAVNNLIAPQTNAAAVAAVAPLSGGATASLGQLNGFLGGQRAASLGRR